MKTLLVTGGAGFIGSNFVRHLLKKYEDLFVVNFDKLTYAGVAQNLEEISDHPRHLFVQGDICDERLLANLFSGKYFEERVVCESPEGSKITGPLEFVGVINFAAESHVDRSILDPAIFLRTNVYGTGVLLDAAKTYWSALSKKDQASFRFVQISTDEVYGSLSPEEAAFTEKSPIAPNSPYAAGKAGGDHVVRAYHETYGLPVLTTRCSNNYGPFQFPEKLIPLMIGHILQKRSLPVYGDGKNVRDWVHVQDHCEGIDRVWREGKVGDVYNIGGENEWTNIDIVHALCDAVDDELQRARQSRALINFVKDRLGHDRRYAIDITKIRGSLGWTPRISFDQGLKETVAWYVQNRNIWKKNLSCSDEKKS